MDLFNQKATIYNPYMEGNIKKWKRTLLPKVRITTTNKTLTTNDSYKSVPVTTLRVPYNSGYIPPEKYKGVGFTLSVGSIVLPFDSQEEIQDNSSGNDFLKTYTQAFTLESIKDNSLTAYQAEPPKPSGLPNAHYRGDNV